MMPLFNDSSPPNYIICHYQEYYDACMCIPLHVNKAQCNKCMRCLGADVLLIMVEDVIWRRRIVEYLLKVISLVFFAQKKYSCSFIKLWLNQCHMDYFTDILTTFLGLGTFSCIAVCGESENSRISSNILICVLKMNGGLTGLKHVINGTVLE